MNPESIGAIAQIIGTAAIIVSLFYLAAQIRQNTRSARSATYQSIVAHIADSAKLFIDDPELGWLFVSEASDMEALPPEKLAKFDLAAGSLLRHYDALYYHYLSGALEYDQWQGFRQRLQDLLSLPAVAAWWRGRSGTFSGRFAAFVNEELLPSVSKDDAA